MSAPRRRILIIDDHAPFRSAARELLEHRGFEVVAEADRATSGLQVAERVAPDAVVLDVRLPDGNGFDVCRALKAANPDLAVLIVSTDEHHARHASDCGAVAFLPKTRLSSADLASLLRGAHEDRTAA